MSNDIDLFWRRVDRSNPDGCWPWRGYVINSGYGNVHFRGRSRTAHSVAFELGTGVDPRGLVVCHRCDNPVCCNPSHHFLGDAIDNAADMVAKGRNRWGGSGGGAGRRSKARSSSDMPRKNNRKPTPRQIELLRRFSEFVNRNDVAPTIREMTELLGNSSTNGVVDILKSLEAKSLVEHRPFSRGYRITDAGRALLHMEVAP